MLPVIIGISSGLLIILVFIILTHFNKKIIYGLILSGIGFLYAGFVWSNLQALITNSFQAILFTFLAYYGIRKNILILAAGYFLHGCWDIAYSFFNEPGLIPPHYDFFCLSLDFTICFYLGVFSKKLSINI